PITRSSSTSRFRLARWNRRSMSPSTFRLFEAKLGGSGEPRRPNAGARSVANLMPPVRYPLLAACHIGNLSFCAVSTDQAIVGPIEAVARIEQSVDRPADARLVVFMHAAKPVIEFGLGIGR